MTPTFSKWSGLKAFLPIERLEEGLSTVALEADAGGAGVRNRRIALVQLFDAVGKLLVGWTQQRVEDEAWLYSLTWAEPPSLVHDYDLAFALMTSLEQPLLESHRSESQLPSGVLAPMLDVLMLLRPRLQELSRRVEFMMARAGDLRMSRQFETVSSAFAERLGVEVGADLNRIAGLPFDEREAALATLDARHPVLRRIVGIASAPSQALADSIVGVAWRALTPTAQAFLTQVGVAGVVNVGASGIYEALKKLATVAIG